MPDFGDVDPNTGRTNTRTQWEGTVDPFAPSVSNGQITPEQWAEYQQKRRRAAILGILGTIGGASALGFVGNALGGAGAGAASASVPGAVGAEAAPLGVGSVSASGALPSGIGLSNAAVGSGTAASGALASSPTASGYAPYAATVPMHGAGAGAAGASAAGASAAAGGVKGILGGLTARDLAALGLVGVSGIGSVVSDRPNLNPTTATSDPNLLKLIQAMQGRLDKSEPLYDSILSMANGLLPTQYQKGGGGMA